MTTEQPDVAALRDRRALRGLRDIVFAVHARLMSRSVLHKRNGPFEPDNDSVLVRQCCNDFFEYGDIPFRNLGKSIVRERVRVSVILARELVIHHAHEARTWRAFGRKASVLRH